MSEREAFDAAARALRAADRSRAELDARLAKRGVDEADRAETLEELERLGYLDDARTASVRAARLAEGGYGNAFIQADLEGRHLPTEAALSALEPERERATRYAGRGAAWLARRGFAADTVEAAVAAEA